MKIDFEQLLGFARLLALALTLATLVLGILALAVPMQSVKFVLTCALVVTEIAALVLWTWADQEPTPS
jgi:hypothetical protein